MVFGLLLVVMYFIKNVYVNGAKKIYHVLLIVNNYHRWRNIIGMSEFYLKNHVRNINMSNSLYVKYKYVLQRYITSLEKSFPIITFQ